MKWRAILVGVVLVAGACSDDGGAVFSTSVPGAEATTTPGGDTATTVSTPSTSGGASSTTAVAAEPGPCLIPDGAVHIDFDDLPSDLGLLDRPAAEPVRTALAVDQFYVSQHDHAAWAGPVGPVTFSDAVIADNPAAVTPDIPSLGTSSAPNVLRVFDEGHLSIVAHAALPGRMDYLGFNVGFGHFSEGFERPDTVELDVVIRLLPFHDLDGSVTEAVWPPFTVTLGPGPQPITTCVYLENVDGVGHPLFATWLVDITPRHGDGTPIHVPIGIDDFFYGCFASGDPTEPCATPWGATGMDLIAFTSSFYQQSFYGLYVVDPDSGVEVPLFTRVDDRDLAAPAWSPEGGRIAYVERGDPSGPDAGTRNLYVIRGDGSDLVQLTSGGNVWGFDWSPDGNHVVYSLGTTDSDADLWVVDAAGGVPSRLTDFGDDVGAVEPEWSPDGSKIAFERGTRIDGIYWQSSLYLVDAGGSSPAPAVTSPLAAGAVNHGHRWSPDSTQLVYSSGFEDGGGVIWVIDVAAGTESSISGGVGEAVTPAWSPVSDRIAFFGWDGGTGIWVVNADGTHLTPLGTSITWGSTIDWSSDGARLAYSAEAADGTGMAVWVVDADGSGSAQITTLPGSEFDSTWSP